MTSFGWKRKVGEKVSRSSSSAFEENSREDDQNVALAEGVIDWHALVPKAKVVCTESPKEKAAKLKSAGETLAENERYWEALKKWEAALVFTPNDETLHEMKAQAYMELYEVDPAVSSATKAAQLAPNWWVALQTLGRSHLGLGELSQAIRCFSKAIHLKPDEKELWYDDLKWSLELVNKKKVMQLLQEQEELMDIDKDDHTVSDDDSDGDTSDEDSDSDVDSQTGSKQPVER